MIFRETRLLDYSFARPALGAIKRSGAVGVVRYLGHSSAKSLTRAEVAELHKAGLSVSLVFEDGADRALHGHAAGVADAVYANRQASALGAPPSVPIFYAVDVAATADEVRAYFAGVVSAGGRPVGAYGDLDVVDGLLALKAVRYGWQTVAWSHGVVSKRAHLYQRNRSKQPVAGTDENVVLHDFPQWTAKMAAPAAKPTPAAKPAAAQVAKPAPHPGPPVVLHDGLFQLSGHPEVWQAVGSSREHVTAAAFAARGLSHRDVTVVPADHPLGSLPQR
jgi:hypothetical protein